MDISPARAVHLCLLVVGTGLLVQGALTIVFLALYDRASHHTHGVLGADGWHGAIHLAWGALMLGALRTSLPERALALLTLAFGIFYVGLAIVGIIVHHPFGLRLGAGENGFHAILGPSVLLVGIYGLWRGGEALVPLDVEGAGQPAGR
jgi:hypothetical protein